MRCQVWAFNPIESIQALIFDILDIKKPTLGRFFINLKKANS